MAFPRPVFIFGIGSRVIDYSRNYGIDNVSGWSVCIRGGVYVQFVSLWKALWVFLFCHWRESR